MYRTSDTYVLGTALAAFVRQKMGPQADLLDDVVWPDVWRKAGLSPVANFSRRTRDDARQPFVGYGLALAEQTNAVTLRYTLTEHWLLEVVSGLTQTAGLLYQLER